MTDASASGDPVSIDQTVELSAQPITDLFRGAVNDEATARDLFELIKQHFRAISRNYKRRHFVGDSLPTDDPVDETFAALLRRDPKLWEGRDHIIGTAAIAMENVIRTHLKKKRADKRGRNAKAIHLSGSDVLDQRSVDPVEELHVYDLLDQLEAAHPGIGTIVRMKQFGKMTYDEIAELVGKTTHQVEYAFHKGLTWLVRRVREDA